MIKSDILITFILTLSFAFGWITSMYKEHALRYNLSIIKALQDDFSILKISSSFTEICVVVLAFFFISWWSALFIVVFGILLAIIMIMLLKHMVQLVAIWGLISSWILITIYIYTNA